MAGKISTVFSRTVLVTAGMGIQGIARLAYTVIIGRFADAGALGDTSALLSLAVYFSLLMPAGLGIAASRFLPVQEVAGTALRYLNRWFWISSTGLMIVAVPTAFWITGDVGAALSCALLVGGYNAYVYTRGILMGEDRIFHSVIADLVSSLIAMTALACVVVGGAHWALLLPLSFGYIVFAMMSRPRTSPVKGLGERSNEVSRFVRDAVISSLATGGLLPATMVFVRAYDSPLQADYFAAALSLATPASMISQAINQVLIPHFSRMRLHSIMQAAQRRMTILTTLLFGVVFGAIIVLAPYILTIIYGSRFTEGAVIMQALLVVVFFISATSAPSAYLLAAGRQRVFALAWLVAFIVGTLTMVVAAPQLGSWGALLGFAVGGCGGAIAVIVSAQILSPRGLPK